MDVVAVVTAGSILVNAVLGVLSFFGWRKAKVATAVSKAVITGVENSIHTLNKEDVSLVKKSVQVASQVLECADAVHKAVKLYTEK